MRVPLAWPRAHSAWLTAWAAALPVALIRARYLSESDTFWEIRTGQVILRTGHIPAVDSFSWWARGRPWAPNSWAFDVLLAAAYRVGGLACVALLGSALVMAACAAILLLARRLGGSAPAAGVGALAVRAVTGLPHVGATIYPIAAVRALPSGCRLFNSYLLGGIVILERPGVPVSIDSRNDLYGRRAVRAEQRILTSRSGGPGVLRRLSVTCVLIPAATGLAGQLRLSPAWRQVTRDPAGTVFVRRGTLQPGPPAPGLRQPRPLRHRPRPAQHRAFHDVVTGDNSVLWPTAVFVGYNAGPGWDPVTGLGSPDAQYLVPLLAHTARSGA